MNNVDVWLYGSRARGDADLLSDTDVLMVGDAGVDTAHIERGLAYPNLKVSFYSWDEVVAMRAYGSLFLYHIATEGRRLQAAANAPHRLPTLLAGLPRFSRARADMDGFQIAFRECRASVANGGWPDFECEVIAAVARHAAILGSYCLGEPTFGRERPFLICARALGYSSQDLTALCKPATGWRLHQAGTHTSPDATVAWLNEVSRFLNALEEVIDDYDRVLQHAA